MTTEMKRKTETRTRDSLAARSSLLQFQQRRSYGLGDIQRLFTSPLAVGPLTPTILAHPTNFSK
jgi:hypothetical protein